MTIDTAHVMALACAAVAGLGLVQLLVGGVAVRRFSRRVAPIASRPAVTVLKPLHGDEKMLEAALASFCAQDYPHFQIVFGVQDYSDSALPVLERLRARFPQVEMDVVIDPAPHGRNRKIANLINMLPFAAHDVLVISDSDMHAPADFLGKVVDALAVPQTGLVSTLYSGLPAGGVLAGNMGSAYINQNFAAGALMARILGRQDCMGATMGLTRETLTRIGGLPALSPFLADDAVLGQKVRALGLNVALAGCVPATTVGEQSLPALFRHELRWARTIRAVEPLGFALSVIQFPVFWALLCVALTAGAFWTLALVAACVAMRAVMGRLIETMIGARTTPLWLPALRDIMSIAVVLAAYTGDEVAWRGHKLSTLDDTLYTARPRLAPGKG